MYSGAGCAPAWVVDRPSAGRHRSAGDHRSDLAYCVLGVHDYRRESRARADQWWSSHQLDGRDRVGNKHVYSDDSGALFGRYVPGAIHVRSGCDYVSRLQHYRSGDVHNAIEEGGSPEVAACSPHDTITL